MATIRTRMTMIAALLIGVLVLVFAFDGAHAQRRRRRHRGRDAGVADAAVVDAAPDAGPPIAPPPDAMVVETPDASEPEPPEPAAVDPTTQQDLAEVMDQLVTARSRIAAIGRQLFHTQIVVRVHDRTEDQVLTRIALTLDGAPIFSSRGSELGDRERQAFSGFAAPGPHVLGIELERRVRGDDAYGYALRESYRFEALRERVTEVTLVLDGDADIAEDFADEGEGEYDVRTRVRVATRER